MSLRPGARVVVFAGAVGAAAATIYALWLRETSPPASVAVPWWLLALIFFLAEAYPVHLYFRREAHSLSFSEFGLVLGLFLASPGELLLAQLCGAGAAIIFVRRQRPMKIAFNLAQFAFTSSLALLAFHAVVPQSDASGPVAWGAAIAAVCASATVGVLLVAAAIRLAGGAAPLRTLPFVAAVALSTSLGSANIGLAAAELLRVNAWAVWVLLIPAATCALAFHAYARHRRRHEHLEFLYSSMRAIQSAPELRAAIRELLEAARAMLSAELAEIILLPRGDNEPILRGVVDPRGEVLLEPVELSQPAELALRAVSLNKEAVLLPRGRSPHVLDPYLAEHGVLDAVVTAVHGEEGVSGLLFVADRTGDVATFTADDRKLLQTFANHAGVVLENDRARERLRYQAFHDDLTGLPNRVLFTERVAEALAQASMRSAWPTVLFLDLDDFKTVNDSLGHGAGDELLLAVADRVRACTGPGELAARFGGDEFAILLPRASAEEAAAFAASLLDSFAQPVPLQDREIAVHPTIGIATADPRAASAEELLRNADVAMYTAKGDGKRRYAIYEPEMHARAKRRQELASALARAVEREEILVHLQPIVSLPSGRIVSFEALARWQHPEHGLLAPSNFIPLAEETGLMTAIGRIVLQQSCRRLAAWQATLAEDTTLAISVNLSPTELQNPTLVEDVDAILSEARLASQHLILEITESTAVRDPAATILRLRQLRDLGIKVALDDFGTGYSSLSHLRELPIDFIKIAKPFIDALQHAESGQTLVKAILHIAEALELDVIAEGIEHAAQAEILSRLNCGFAQGYHFSAPLDEESATALLRATVQQQWRDAQRRRRAPGPRQGETLVDVSTARG